MNGSGGEASASGGGKADRSGDDGDAADTAKKKTDAGSSGSSWWWPCTSGSPVDEAEFILFSGDDKDEWFIMEFENVESPAGAAGEPPADGADS